MANLHLAVVPGSDSSRCGPAAMWPPQDTQMVFDVATDSPVITALD